MATQAKQTFIKDRIGATRLQTTTLADYRNSSSELARTEDLLAIVPKNLSTVLDVGARDGHFSLLLANHFESVIALDLTAPTFHGNGVMAVQGDTTRLPFPDRVFDVVFCAEVLEHIPKLKEACSEIERVARHAILIGVPFCQDTRLGRTTCNHCGKVNPPWGHVNTFTEQKLASLFPKSVLVKKSFVGSSNGRTNPFSTFLMDAARNPWGVYNQEEACIHCGLRIDPPASRSFSERLLAAVAVRLNRVQSVFTPSHSNWIHVLFHKAE